MYEFEETCAFMSVTLNIGQNYFGGFFCLSISVMKRFKGASVFSYVIMLYCLADFVKTYYNIARLLLLPVAWAPAKRSGYFCIFNNTNIFPQAAGWSSESPQFC